MTKNNDKLKCQVWNFSRKVSELYTDFCTSSEFTGQFKRLNAVLKEMEIKDNNRPYLNIKIIDLNRNTLKLYKRLDDKNQKTINS